MTQASELVTRDRDIFVLLMQCAISMLFATGMITSLWLAFGVSDITFIQRVGYGILTIIQGFIFLMFVPTTGGNNGDK